MIKQGNIIFIIGIVIGLLGFGSVLDCYQKERMLNKEIESLEKEQELIQETEVVLETKELEEEIEIGKISRIEYFESKKEEGKPEHNDIRIYCPKLSGFFDLEKEKRINLMIEHDTKNWLKLHQEVRDKGNLKYYLEYKNVFKNMKMISILYKGYSGATYFSGAGYVNMAMATTISLEEEKVLTLGDVITDFNRLCDFLLEDRFQDISLWEQTEVPYSQNFPNREGLERDLNYYLSPDKNKEYCNIQWYTDGEHFIFVRLWGKYYYEYAIKIEEIKEILSEEFLSLLD